MQIHELNNYTGTPGSTDYLAIDTGEETFKVGANNLGVTTPMTQAEAEAGTSTDLRVITPKVLHECIEEMACLVLSKASFTSLPQTITDSRITSDMVALKAVLGTPSAQTGDWTVTTSDGSLTVSGSISGSTTLTLYLQHSR